MDNVRLNRRGLMAVLSTIPFFSFLPIELKEPIADLVHANDCSSTSSNIKGPEGPRLDPSVPPKHSARPIDGIPPELIRKIISQMLPAKDKVIKCLCGEADTKDPNRKPRRNQLSDLLTINKNYSNIVKDAVYEERFFEVHVHQGGSGGIEFLDAGYQPLAYCDSAADDRFAKFSSGEYGFCSLKKVVIKIFPADTTKRYKAIPLNTFFMVQALCRLLERGGEEKDRIVNISISFPEGESSSNRQNRHHITADEHYWWDSITRVPRCTSIHGIPDIELVLYPLARLTRVHNVNIDLPAMVREHQPTVDFVARLVAGMRSASSLPSLLLSDEQEVMIQSMRDEVEGYIFSQKFGRTQHDVGDMGEDVMEHKQQEDDDDAFEAYGEHDEVDKMAWELTGGDSELQAAIMASFNGEPPRVLGSSPPLTNNEVPLTGQLHRERRAATAEHEGLNATMLPSRRNHLWLNRFRSAGRSESDSAPPSPMPSTSIKVIHDFEAGHEQTGESQFMQLIAAHDQVKAMRERTDATEEAQRDSTTADHRGGSSAASTWCSIKQRFQLDDSDQEMTGV